tara:strand:- start:521 stop:772 length:252 start_codon:yes stop_codon:yes gene_type:complete
MSNNKQSSSIDWLYEKMFVHHGLITIEEFKQAREMYQDEIEAAIIKDCATESTSAASSYAEGYKEGYKRALELVKWTINYELQ